jgi:hypothetical protein
MLGDDNNSISVGWGMDYGTTNEASGAYRAKFNPRDPSQEMQESYNMPHGVD